MGYGMFLTYNLSPMTYYLLRLHARFPVPLQFRNPRSAIRNHLALRP